MAGVIIFGSGLDDNSKAATVPASRKPDYSNGPFAYRPLNAQNHEIRILTIYDSYRTSSDEASYLLAKLDHVSLVDPGDYAALSYCWGDKSQPFFVVMNDDRTKFSITMNLNRALWALWWRATRLMARSSTTVRIWVDAICINQNDDHERSLQVENMRKIYSKAVEVVAFVGPYTAGSPNHDIMMGLDSAISKLSSEQKSIGRSSRSSRKSDLGPPQKSLPKDELNALENFFNEKFWERVWIIQELTVNPNVTVLYGDTESRWEDVVSVLNVISKAPFVETKYRASHLLQFREAFMNNTPITLFQALGWTVAAKSTDPRDKIFALLGLCHDGFKCVKVPNYSQPLEAIIHEMTVEMIRLYRNLDLICLVPVASLIAENQSAPPAPSWVSQWISMWANGAPEGTMNDIFIPGLSSFNFNPLSAVIPVTGFLVVEVIRIGTLSSLTSSLGRPKSHSSSTTAEWLHKTKQLASRNPNLANPTSTEIHHKWNIWNTLTGWNDTVSVDVAASADCFKALWTPVGRGSIYNSEIIHWIDDNASFKIGPWSLREWSRLEVPVAGNPLAQKGVDEHKYNRVDAWAAVNHALEVNMAAGSRLASLEGAEPGRYDVALTGPYAKVGDEVAYVRGCSWPVVLRRDTRGGHLIVDFGRFNPSAHKRHRRWLSGKHFQNSSRSKVETMTLV